VICFGPSDVLVGRVKSGALVPTASGMAEFQYRIDVSPVKKDRAIVIALALNRSCRFTIDGSRFTNPMEAFWWLFAIVLMALGLIGTVIPILPGTTIILAAAVVHRLVLGADRSLGWSALIAMLALTLLTYAIDAAAGYVGAKRFGATKWGLIGGAAGALIGLFFGLFGLFVGPVIGAIAGELIGGKQITKAGRAGWGTFLGGLAGVIAKLFIGLIMIVIFLMNVPSPL